MIAELEKDPEFQAIFANLALNEFEPEARYDHVGDCIEFFAENVAFNGVRLDDWITMYISESDGRIVGCQVKRIKRLFKQHPDLQQIVLVQDNKMRLDYLFVAAAMKWENTASTAHRYNELKRATEGVEVPLP